MKLFVITRYRKVVKTKFKNNFKKGKWSEPAWIYWKHFLKYRTYVISKVNKYQINDKNNIFGTTMSTVNNKLYYVINMQIDKYMKTWIRKQVYKNFLFKIVEE